MSKKKRRASLLKVQKEICVISPCFATVTHATSYRDFFIFYRSAEIFKKVAQLMSNIEDQDHLKYVTLKIKIRSPKRPELVDQDQITFLILRSRSDLEDFTQYH